MKKIRWSFILALIALPNAYACTDLQLQADDGSTIIGRTMDFDRPLQSALAIYPRGEKRTSLQPDGSLGLSWVSRYAYVGMNELGNRQMISDGMNEQGLALEDLWLAETQYNPATGHDKAVLLLYDLPAWLLGNFSSVAEVKKNLATIQLWANKIPVLHSVTPLHFAVHDQTGAQIVIEFLNGETHIMDNPVGVLTNSPSFAWQLTNLRNYVGLTASEKTSSEWGSLHLTPTGPGSGLLGLPGDYTPVSRFVKAAVLVHFAGKTSDGKHALIQMMHLINNFDVPYDAIHNAQAQYPGGDYSQWTMIKNLQDKQLFIRPQNALHFYEVDLTKIFSDTKTFHSVALSQFTTQDKINVSELLSKPG